MMTSLATLREACDLQAGAQKKVVPEETRQEILKGSRSWHVAKQSLSAKGRKQRRSPFS